METWFLTLYIFTQHCIPRISTELSLSLKIATLAIGDTVRLNCSDADKRPLYWIHQPAGSSIEYEISYPGSGILTKYQEGGRHRVEMGSGSCDLEITNISDDDAGTYICYNADGKQTEIQLIVIDSGPRCISNTSLADLVCDNDCNLDPDKFELNCSVVYHGNIPPILEWRHSGSSKSIPFKTTIETQSTSNHTITIKSSTLSPSIALNGTHYVCSLENMRTERWSSDCVTENIHVTYFYKSSISRSIPTSNTNRGKISCQANTSEQCNYRWEGTAVSTGTGVEYVGQTIDLADQEFKDMRCLAECRIRGNTCTAEPLMLKFEDEHKEFQDATVVKNWFAGIFFFLISMAVIGIAVAIWKTKLFASVCQRYLGTPIKPKSQEMERLNQEDGGDVIGPSEVQFILSRWADLDSWINKYGSEKIDSKLIARFEQVTGKPAHYLLKRGLVFSHRDLDMILDRHERKEPFYLYTGRGPSSTSLHIGHLVPITFTKWLQETFDVPLVIQMTDDDKFMLSDQPLEDIHEMAIENVKDIIAFGFDPLKTFIFINTDYISSTPEFYRNICRIQNEVTLKQIQDVFGYVKTDKIGTIGFPVIQAAPSFSSSFPQIFDARTDIQCLIPCGIDQDPFFRMTGDVARRLGFPKPALIYAKFIPALQGAPNKMSSSKPNTAVYLTDTPTDIECKIKKYALEGNGDCDIDVSFQYLRFFMEDDERLEEIRTEFENGTIATIDMKRELIRILHRIVADHQERRRNITTEVAKLFMKPRKLKYDFGVRSSVPPTNK